MCCENSRSSPLVRIKQLLIAIELIQLDLWMFSKTVQCSSDIGSLEYVSTTDDFNHR